MDVNVSGTKPSLSAVRTIQDEPVETEKHPFINIPVIRYVDGIQNLFLLKWKVKCFCMLTAFVALKGMGRCRLYKLKNRGLIATVQNSASWAVFPLRDVTVRNAHLNKWKEEELNSEQNS